jgi:hypothetical protein
MGDLIFVVVVVAFFALSVAYVKACERIVGPDSGADILGEGDTDDAAGALEATPGTAR